MVGSGVTLKVMCWVKSIMDSRVMLVKVVCFEEKSRELCEIVGSMLARIFIVHNHSMNRSCTFMVAEDQLVSFSLVDLFSGFLVH